MCIRDSCNKERGRVYLYDGGKHGKDRLTRLSDDDISVFDIDSYKDEYGLFYGAESGGMQKTEGKVYKIDYNTCLLYTSCAIRSLNCSVFSLS